MVNRRNMELPPPLADRARAFITEGAAPAPARPASSVVLVRDGNAGLEVYVHVRHTTMAFAGGMLAFPGGSADADDTARPIEDEALWAQRLSTDVTSARAHVRAALRETLEETSIGLTPDDLHPWAHWITPRFEPRRYDTWFFLAVQPPGCEARDVSGEASAVAWAAPGALIDGSELPGVRMLPPTRSVLDDLSGWATVRECVAAARTRTIETVLPGWIDDGFSVCALLPGDDGYPGDDPGDRS